MSFSVQYENLHTTELYASSLANFEDINIKISTQWLWMTQFKFYYNIYESYFWRILNMFIGFIVVFPALG